MAKAQYEGMFLLPGSAEVEASIKRVRDIIEKHGGSILVIKKWDERKLAFEVKKQKRGLYILAYFTGPGTAIAPITRDVNLSDDILRVLITDASHLSKDEMERVEPQPVVQYVPQERSNFENNARGGGDRGGYRRREEETANA
ncbi:MAG: 30S ribosomal protein S6 [Tepidisphaeraceae bacterium]